MKIRFIKPGQKDRLMIRTNVCEEIIAGKEHAQNRGLTPVGLVGFWKHVLFWWKKPKKKSIK